MKTPTTFAAVVLLATALLGAGTAHADATAEAGWSVVSKDDRVTVMSRSKPNSSVKEIRASGVVDCPAWILKNVVDDVEGYTELIPYTTAASIVASDAGERISHQRIEMPFLEPREYVVSIHDESKVTTDGRSVYRTTWRTASDKYQSFVTEGVVRVTKNDGSWTFEELADGRTLATFQMAVDPEGSLPTALVNIAQRFTVAKYLDNLETRAAMKQYRAHKVALR